MKNHSRFIEQDITTQIKIHIPEGYSTEGKTMKIMSPDFEGEVAVDFTIEGEMIVFTLPALYIWDIAIVE